MSVMFVIGPSCSGKSTYIENRYPNIKKIDLYDYQKHLFERKFFSIPDILKSYEDCKIAIIEAVKNNEDIVVEHTLSKASKRKEYIDAIREISNTPIGIVVIYPSDSKILENAKKRNVKITQADLDNYKKVFEMPTPIEGFSKITILRNNI